MSKTDKPTPKKDEKVEFLRKLRIVPNVSKAAKAAGINRQYAYELRASDAEFAAAWDEAVESSTDAAEAEAFRRAVKGTVKPVFHMGEKVGGIREYSDTLLIFLLKAHRPEKYRDAVKVTGSGKNGEIEHAVAGEVKHSVDESTAGTIFDILESVGAIKSGAGDTEDESIHPASADT